MVLDATQVHPFSCWHRFKQFQTNETLCNQRKGKYWKQPSGTLSLTRRPARPSLILYHDDGSEWLVRRFLMVEFRVAFFLLWRFFHNSMVGPGLNGRIFVHLSIREVDGPCSFAVHTRPSIINDQGLSFESVHGVDGPWSKIRPLIHLIMIIMVHCPNLSMRWTLWAKIFVRFLHG